jgi:hypothetical protein
MWLATFIGLKAKIILIFKQDVQLYSLNHTSMHLPQKSLSSTVYITLSQRRYALSIPDVNLTSEWWQSDKQTSGHFPLCFTLRMSSYFSSLHSCKLEQDE